MRGNSDKAIARILFEFILEENDTSYAITEIDFVFEALESILITEAASSSKILNHVLDDAHSNKDSKEQKVLRTRAGTRYILSARNLGGFQTNFRNSWLKLEL